MPLVLSPSLQIALSIFQTPQTVDVLLELPIENLVSLLVYLVCEDPSTIEVATSKEGKTTVVNFTLGPTGKARVIGKNGHTIKALCSLCRSIERARGLDVVLEVIDKQ